MKPTGCKSLQKTDLTILYMVQMFTSIHLRLKWDVDMCQIDQSLQR